MTGHRYSLKLTVSRSFKKKAKRETIVSTYHGLEVGDEIELEIKEKARDGRGLARSKGLLIFVEGASLGETVKARIVKIGSRHAHAEVVTAHRVAMAKANP